MKENSCIMKVPDCPNCEWYSIIDDECIFIIEEN